jgi:hypothetical protein
MPAGRKLHEQLLHEISAQFGPASPLNGVLGVLPAGAVLNGVHVAAITAFNSTTNTVAIGTTPGGAQLLAATDLKTVARTDAAAPAAAAGPFSVDTPIYYTLAPTGAAPTAGLAVGWIDYVPHIGASPISNLKMPRRTHYQALHAISGQGGFGQLSGLLGVAPWSSFLNSYHWLTSQAFNSTTNTLSLGTTPGGVDIANAVNIQAVGNGSAVVPIGPAGQPENTGSNVPIYYTLGSTGAAPTTGVITVWIDYIPGKETG